jgi:3-isopropylmalate dehydrogenase
MTVSSREITIALLPGDGIGPEITRSAVAVLDAVAGRHGLRLHYTSYEAGAELYRRSGVGISAEVLDELGKADAILFGAMGLPDVRQEDGREVAPQLELREHFQLLASIRPIQQFDGIPRTLRSGNVNMEVIRETTEGLFAHRNDPIVVPDQSVTDRLTITRATSERLFELAFDRARHRRAAGGPGKVTLLDKSNALPSFVFLRKIFDEVAARHPDITTERLYVDSASMLMILDPDRFDVVVTENLLGDIVSELAAGLIGGIGLSPSAEVGTDHALFQPCHGSAPDLAGRGTANPLATVLSAAMLLDWVGRRRQDDAAIAAAAAIDAAVAAVIENGPHTPDLGGSGTTDAVTAAIITQLTPDLAGV